MSYSDWVTETSARIRADTERVASFEEYVIDVRVAIHASDEQEAFELIAEAVRARIDGHLLSAQRQARVVSVSVNDGQLIENINALHDAIQAYNDATVALEPPAYAEELHGVVHDLWWYLRQKAVQP